MTYDEINYLYGKACDIWKGFAENHNELYQLACEEYVLLLDSELEKLEECIDHKTEIIKRIEKLEAERTAFIRSINSAQDSVTIVKARDLLTFFEAFVEDDLLEKYNKLLVDIIEKIQDQNKRNQIFLNKALTSIDEIKRGFSGKKYVETYNQRGQKQVNMK